MKLIRPINAYQYYNFISNKTCRTSILQKAAFSSNMPDSANKYIEEKICIGEGINVNCLRTGGGNKNILCLPGSLGTIWTDFQSQITGFDLTQFSLTVWEPLGYGKSIPPQRDYSEGFLEKDADHAYQLLQKYGIKKASLLGWSDGGITALILAGKYPQIVDKLVVWGSNSYVTQTDVDLYEKIRNIENWSPGMRNTMSKIYGQAELQRMMNSWVDATHVWLNKNNGSICNDVLPKIEAPTLIIHGNKDPLVPNYHVDYLRENIKNSRVYEFPEGKHNVHIKYAAEFNQTVADFLLQ